MHAASSAPRFEAADLRKVNFGGKTSGSGRGLCGLLQHVSTTMFTFRFYSTAGSLLLHRGTSVIRQSIMQAFECQWHIPIDGLYTQQDHEATRRYEESQSQCCGLEDILTGSYISDFTGHALFQCRVSMELNGHLAFSAFTRKVTGRGVNQSYHQLFSAGLGSGFWQWWTSNPEAPTMSVAHAILCVAFFDSVLEPYFRLKHIHSSALPVWHYRRQAGWAGGHMLLWQSTVNARLRSGTSGDATNDVGRTFQCLGLSWEEQDQTWSKEVQELSSYEVLPSGFQQVEGSLLTASSGSRKKLLLQDFYDASARTGRAA